MKVVGIDGKEYKLKLNDNIGENKSSYHLLARELLKQHFSFDGIYEEVLIPGGSSNLYCDFLIPRRNLMVEVHGEQHYRFVQHFHGDKIGFLKSRKRDYEKFQFCELNNFCLLELSYREKDGWPARIINYTENRRKSW